MKEEGVFHPHPMYLDEWKSFMECAAGLSSIAPPSVKRWRKRRFGVRRLDAALFYTRFHADPGGSTPKRPRGHEMIGNGERLW